MDLAYLYLLSTFTEEYTDFVKNIESIYLVLPSIRIVLEVDHWIWAAGDHWIWATAHQIKITKILLYYCQTYYYTTIIKNSIIYSMPLDLPILLFSRSII
jgi:hypothetical protein